MNEERMVESTYRIGAVSKITGVPADTLRVWERRYDVVRPRRTEGGSRVYSQQDVARLELIKRLVDSGHAIGTVANLSYEQLQERASAAHLSAVPAPTPRKGPLRVVLLGSTLPLRLESEYRAEADDSVKVVATFLNADDFQEKASLLRADTLVVELPTLKPDSPMRVRRLQRLCSASAVVVVYGFGSSDLASSMEGQGIVTLRFPVSWDEIRRNCLPAAPPSGEREASDDIRGHIGEPIPPRLYTDQQLAKVSRMSTTVKCECPHHLSDLIVELARFEQYSAECENQTREDAALHAYLHVTTARARATMERALEKLVEAEGVDIDSPDK